MADLTAMMQAAAGNTGEANFIEEVFSTYLYTGNGSTQTITNGIDLSTEGGLVWIKSRNLAEIHQLFDTERGIYNRIYSNLTNAQNTGTNSLTAFNSNGFSIGDNNISNTNNDPLVSWTFRKQPKFFDVLTYTGNGTNRTIAHNLGSVPGCIIIKDASAVSNWYVYHRSLATNQALKLNSTAAIETSTTFWNNTAATSSVFSLGTAGDVNGNGDSFVAYVFAHDAGGFGLTGTDNVISCGSYTGNGSASGPVVTLGYEPQWVMWKKSDSGTESWHIRDVMRGMPVTASGKDLYADSSSAEGSTTNEGLIPTATGFQVIGTNSNANTNGGTYIYIAIRRGPMKVPTVGTSVYMGATRTGNGAVTALTAAGFPPDLYWAKSTAAVRDHAIFDRLRGPLPVLSSNNTQNEIAYTDDLKSFDMTGVTTGTDGSTNAYNQNGVAYVNWYMRRAPSFMDVVCYTGGTGTPRVLNHNLTTPPELVITKIRNFAGEDWVVHYNNGSSIIGGYLNNTTAFANSSTAPSTDITSLTSTTYTLNTSNRRVNGAYNYVAYLFATCAGVSKVGSYTGTATTLQIDCGFTAGARFVLIKRTDSTGDWYVWDSARGIVAGDDPYLLLNSTAAEVTNTDYVDTYSAGFEISSTAPAAINASAGTFVFLAIA